MQSNKSLGYSIILHVALFLVILFGLPSLFEKKLIDDSVITVEILPVSELTNVKTIKQKPVEKSKNEVTSKTKPKPALPEPEIKSKPIETPAKEEAKPNTQKAEIKKPEPEVQPEKKPQEVKKEEKKDKKTKDKAEDDAFKSVLKSVEKIQPDKAEEKTDEKADFSKVEDMLANVSKEDKFQPEIPLSVSEKDAVKQQIMNNWTVLAGAKDAADMIVNLRISVSKDGSVTAIKIGNQVRYNSDPFYRATVDSAVRAVYKSSPLQNLPAEKYDSWSEMDLNFDPSEMMY